MKICNPKNILISLIVLFLIFNAIFLYHYLFYFEENSKKNNDGISTVEFLKSFVDFNHTTFENKGVVHFYYPANKKVDFKLNIIKEYNKSTNYLDDLSKVNKCEFIHDKEDNIFLDSNKILCKEESFDYYTQCCITTKIYEHVQISNNCEEKSQCCKNEYACIKSCMSIYKSNFQICRNNCKMNILTKNYSHPHCYISSLDSSQSLSLTLSNFNFSCEETCLLKNLTCYNHMLLIYNDDSCKYFSNCTACIKDESYGPGISTNICFYSDKFRISCNYKRVNLQRLCTCI